jgi:hypothetical protein
VHPPHRRLLRLDRKLECQPDQPILQCVRRGPLRCVRRGALRHT